MKKHFLVFALSSCWGISHAFAQSSVSTTQNQATVITVADSLGKSTNTHGTISKAGKNQQSVYTPPTSGTENNAPGPGNPPMQASPDKGQPATVGPKQ